MNKYDEALTALAEPVTDAGLAGAEIDHEPRKTSYVLSVRMPADLAMRLFTEVERRGVTSSRLTRELVKAGLDAADESETVRLADVHRVIDSLAHRQSA